MTEPIPHVYRFIWFPFLTDYFASSVDAAFFRCSKKTIPYRPYVCFFHESHLIMFRNTLQVKVLTPLHFLFNPVDGYEYTYYACNNGLERIVK